MKCEKCNGTGEISFKNPNIKPIDDIKIVRELKDLDGLENGMGLKFKIEQEYYEVDFYDFLILRTEKDRYISYSLTDKEALKTNVDFFKGMGFKFVYKPLRIKEEILKDLVEKDFKYGEGNFILIQHEHGTWDHMNNMSFKTPGQKYYTLDSIKKVVYELNEILGSKL